MENKNLIKNWLILNLVVITGFTSFSWILYNEQTAQAAINNNEAPLVDISLDSNANNYTIDELRHDTDQEGNQVYVWKSDYFDSLSETSCSAIIYQVYNRAGIPLIMPKIAASDCAASTSLNNPDVSFVDGGFTVVYGRYSSGRTGTTMSIDGVFIDENYTAFSPVSISDSGQLARNPRIASDLYGNSNTVGVVYESCGNEFCDDEIDLYFQALNSFDLSRISANNFLVNTTSGEINTYSNIAFANTHYMVSWKNDDGNTTSIKARAILPDTTNSSPEIIISNTGNNEDMPDIAGLMGELPLDRAGNSLDYFQNFYIAYTATTQATLSSDILIKKVICESTLDTIQSTYSINCYTTSRNGEEISVRANVAGNAYDYQPAISAFKGNNQILRVDDDQSSRIDYITVAWLNSTDLEAQSSLTVQNYTDSLVKTGNMIEISNSVSSSRGIGLSSNQDGHFTVTYSNALGHAAPHSLIYPTQYLRIGSEKLVNPPDSNIESDPVVAVGPDGSFAVAYEYMNNTRGDMDIIYNLYDRYGNAIKSNAIANESTSGNQNNPRIEFFHEDSGSPDFGKFVIAWEGEGSADTNGIYYRIFNADGSAASNEILANDSPITIQSYLDLAVGKNGQIAIVYTEVGTVKLVYINDGTPIYSTIGTNGSLPLIALNPVADGSTGLSGKSKFAISFNTLGGKTLTEGYLDTGNNLTLLSPQSNSDTYIDLEGGYRADFESGLTVNSGEGFFYVASYLNADSTPIITANIFNSNYEVDIPFNGDDAAKISVDPVSGNIMTIHQKTSRYSNYWEPLEVFLSPAYNLSTFFSEMHIIDELYQYQADVINNFGTYAFLQNTTGIFDSVRVGTYDPITTTSINEGLRLDFGTDVSSHFNVGQIITGQTSGQTARVAAISNFFIIIENQTGNFIPSETLDNSPYNDQIINSTDTTVFHFDFDLGFLFEVGNDIRNENLDAMGTIQYVSGPVVSAITTLGNFTSGENVLDFTAHGFASADSIEYPEVSINRLEITIIPAGANPEERYPEWFNEGPSFSASHNLSYGQIIQNSYIDYNTSSTDTDGRLAVAIYSTNTALDRLDNNGIYLQMIEDPYNLGTREDLSPSAEQQINAGGKYIIVPQTIDFGLVDRNTTNTVRFSDLTPACLQVTDLDGTDFDLTVTLTDLINPESPSEIIPSSQFYIENNDGINPDITTTYSFSSLSDVTLDASTDPGQNADLGTTRTLLRKNNSNTGSYTICPTLNFNVPANAPTGTANGVLTFTLI